MNLMWSDFDGELAFLVQLVELKVGLPKFFVGIRMVLEDGSVINSDYSVGLGLQGLSSLPKDTHLMARSDCAVFNKLQGLHVTSPCPTQDVAIVCKRKLGKSIILFLYDLRSSLDITHVIFGALT